MHFLIALLYLFYSRQELDKTTVEQVVMENEILETTEKWKNSTSASLLQFVVRFALLEMGLDVDVSPSSPHCHPAFAHYVRASEKRRE